MEYASKNRLDSIPITEFSRINAWMESKNAEGIIIAREIDFDLIYALPID